VQFGAGALGLPELPSNVTNAIGFLGGVVTKSALYESCSWSGPAPLPLACDLTYDREKATLVGTVTDACTHRLVNGATVRLEPLLPTPRKVRSVPTGSVPLPLNNYVTTAPSSYRATPGGYRIAGLEARVRYALSVSHPATAGPDTPLFRIHSDTLELAPGEERRVDVGLERTDPSLPIDTPFGRCIRP
jgi:hypothetical protein